MHTHPHVHTHTHTRTPTLPPHTLPLTPPPHTPHTASDPDRISGLKAWNANNPAKWWCSVWPVDTPLKTFLAIRSMDPPPAECAVQLLPKQEGGEEHGGGGGGGA